MIQTRKQKNGRRGTFCGCFVHGNYLNELSSGIRLGLKVTDVAVSNDGPVPAMASNASTIVLGRSNPGLDANGNLKQRIPISAVPGRFFGQGTLFSCDGEHLHLVDTKAAAGFLLTYCLFRISAAP